jgi:hypothetical protein
VDSSISMVPSRLTDTRHDGRFVVDAAGETAFVLDRHIDVASMAP